MNFYPHISLFLSDLDKIWYKRSASNAVEHFFFKFRANRPNVRPYFFLQSYKITSIRIS
jgi:hypothetical protein